MFWLKNKNWFKLVLVILFYSIDQLSKKLVLHEVGLNNSDEFIAGIINLTVVQNTGGAFSIFKDYPVLFKVIGVINVFVFSYLIFFRKMSWQITTGCAFILGGTLGNLKDRFVSGAVTDFFDLQLFNFAIFNIADIFIDIGVVLILIGWFLLEKEKKQTAQHNGSST